MVCTPADSTAAVKSAQVCSSGQATFPASAARDPCPSDGVAPLHVTPTVHPPPSEVKTNPARQGGPSPHGWSSRLNSAETCSDEIETCTPGGISPPVQLTSAHCVDGASNSTSEPPIGRPGSSTATALLPSCSALSVAVGSALAVPKSVTSAPGVRSSPFVEHPPSRTRS